MLVVLTFSSCAFHDHCRRVYACLLCLHLAAVHFMITAAWCALFLDRDMDMAVLVLQNTTQTAIRLPWA